MPKETYYFPHDYTAGNNPKIRAMLCTYSAWGYGTYWYIIELLHQNDDHKLPLKKYIYSAIAQQMSTNVEQVLKFISDCIEEYELFQSEGGFFFSERVNKNIEKRLEISEKRSLSGKKSAELRKEQSTNVEQMSTSVQQNPTKEKKRKETTIKSSIATVPLLSEVILYFDEKGYSEQSAKKAFEYYTNLNWHNKNGNPIINWKNSMLNNWFKPDNLKITSSTNIRPIDHKKNAEGWK